MYKRFVGVVMVIAAIMFADIAVADITIGVNSPRGKLNTIKKWSEYGAYLQSKLNEKVTILPLSPSELVAQSANVDMMLANPVQSVVLLETTDAKALATLKKKNGAQFAGVIVAKKNSGITKSEDLRGKKVIALGKKAAGGYVFQAYHLLQKGINPETDFKQLRRAKKQDDMVLAVKAGVMDAAFIRSGILEAMHKEGKININEFVVIDERSGDGLNLRHTTQLYPEFYLMKMSKTPSNKAESVRKLSVQMTADTKAAQTAKIKGFVNPVDMSSMKQALKALKINPYN